MAVDLRFSTFDVSSTFSSEMIRSYSFSTLRARHLTVTGMIHLEAIGDGFLAQTEAELVAFDGDAARLKSIGDGWLSASQLLASVSFEGLSSLRIIGDG